MAKNRRQRLSQASPDNRHWSDAFRSNREHLWLGAAAALLFVALVVVYQPALYGSRIWDDDAHITRPELQPIGGLFRVWFEIGATQQYYPLLHSAFWIEHRLWGDHVVGYHLVNIFWHWVATILVYSIVRKLNIPGAILAATIFAFHPVMVESVAWITEQKNTLSTVLYLAAMRVYLDFDTQRKCKSYALSLGLFVLGLLTKTVTASLPAALLVIFWWQRGKLSWRRDVHPLLPFFVLGAAGGLMTAWVERKLIGAEGAEFDLSMIDRCLLAGRVVWFYAAKLFWPTNLTFIYPRWEIDQHAMWQWLFPIATLAMTVGMLAFSRRSRAPLAGWLLFCGTLFPVMGFFNVYPFRYSYVADHFQYLAALGLIVPFAAGFQRVLDRQRARFPLLAVLAPLALVSVLAALTWRQSRMYSDLIALYQTTINRNPECWMAENNLSDALFRANRPEEAVKHSLRAIQIKPGFANAHSNLGIQLCTLGRLNEGIQHLQEAVRLDPTDANAYLDLANACLLLKQPHEAVRHCQKAVSLQPDDPFVRLGLGIALHRAARNQEAVIEIKQAIELRPDYAEAYSALGQIYANMEKHQDALLASQTALKLARSQGQLQLAAQIESWLTTYRGAPGD